ncbi:hypothetical protein C3K47_09680 [Solitalea longa]|uniref:Uncharacterized protein n=1 Tax=Solitalea longa TaxID=2079460 RepID=A0A2S5A279_9SPHI|nr:hypothetical protein [Solitalea longa]POY36634.1 hypothetical protein C3K47_09680 [Solitalea longa]
MLEIETLYTGIQTHQGEKIYLGDKLLAPYMHPGLVQYDFQNKRFVVTGTGKDHAYYRFYELTAIVEAYPKLRVVHNQIIYKHAFVGDNIKVSVDNVKNSALFLGELATVSEVREWDITAASVTDPERTAVLQFGQFLESWRLREDE